MIVCVNEDHQIHKQERTSESCDKLHITMNWNIYMFQVAELVTSEFFEQGDRERLELKLTPSVSSSFNYHIFTLLNDIFKNNSKLQVGNGKDWKWV